MKPSRPRSQRPSFGAFTLIELKTDDLFDSQKSSARRRWNANNLPYMDLVW